MIVCPNANPCCKNAVIETELVNKDKGGRFFSVLEETAVLRFSKGFILIHYCTYRSGTMCNFDYSCNCYGVIFVFIMNLYTSDYNTSYLVWAVTVCSLHDWYAISFNPHSDHNKQILWFHFLWYGTLTQR